MFAGVSFQEIQVEISKHRQVLFVRSLILRYSVYVRKEKCIKLLMEKSERKMKRRRPMFLFY